MPPYLFLHSAKKDLNRQVDLIARERGGRVVPRFLLRGYEDPPMRYTTGCVVIEFDEIVRDVGLDHPVDDPLAG